MHWQIEHPTARKQHRCEMCLRIIEPGERYLRGSGMDGSSAWTWKECAHCEAMRIIWDISDGEEYNGEMFYEWSRECESLAQLRHAASYRMQWRTRRGTLLPIPTSTGSES